MVTSINHAFMQISKRAETNQRSTLLTTFVDVGPLFTLISTLDHQVIYGRRGTGKTHALSYLAERREALGDAVVFIDLRNIGSTGGLYSDQSKSISQRASHLLIDTLSVIHEAILAFCVTRADELDLSVTGPLLDHLGDAITEVRVVGTVESEVRSNSSCERAEESEAGLAMDTGKISLTLKASDKSRESRGHELKRKETGPEEHRVQFGSVSSALRGLVGAFGARRLWLLLDEWSSLPLDLQPYLADFFRRSMFGIPGIAVKIAAIEQRSRFRLVGGSGDYTGIELGADAAADLNLDDFMVFDNDSSRSKHFFEDLLYKHYKSIAQEEPSSGPQSPADLARLAFTQTPAFEEFVRASEGVPRDAINILSLAAQRALDDRISTIHVRKAALDWFQRDKEAAVRSNPKARILLHWIIDVVIGERRARAFLLRSDHSHELVDSLFDSRVLHLLKRNISARDTPGTRYDAYKLDFGCYVDLISTSKAPLGLLSGYVNGNDVGYIEIPPDDYRSIRRAILELDEFDKNLEISKSIPF